MNLWDTRGVRDSAGLTTRNEHGAGDEQYGSGLGRRPRSRPTRAEAEAAVRCLILWAGDDPDREGLLGTPDRVARSYEEFFGGYDLDPRDMLQRTFEEVEGYDEVVVLRDIRVESHCEH